MLVFSCLDSLKHFFLGWASKFYAGIRGWFFMRVIPWNNRHKPKSAAFTLSVRNNGVGHIVVTPIAITGIRRKPLSPAVDV